MIQPYVNKLFESLPEKLKNTTTPIEIDLVLEGGAFNGSYLVGSLFFLKKMEKNNIIEIKRISGASVGAFMGLLYFMDSLDLVYDLYNITLNDFKKKCFINIQTIIKNHFKNNIPNDVCSKINNKLFITYTNIKKVKKTTISKYKDIDFLLDTIIKSCFIPILINKKIFYKNKYIDGLLPYVFPFQKQRKILYLDITSHDKIYSSINIKNEKTNFHRVLTGLLETHKFFIKKHSTCLCSYVNKWSIVQKMYNNCKKIVEMILMYLLFIIYLLKQFITPEINNHFVFKSIKKCFNILYISIIINYCI